MSGVMPTSPSRAGVVSRSSHGDTGEVRKSLGFGFKKSGEAEEFCSVRHIEGGGLSELPDNAEAIACAAASSLADIGRATVELSSGTEDGSEDLLEANIFK
jgi:hypothetical protein